ncbi:MAG: hypothetical protein IH846_12690, partial [Acidobacteria bacterium]|nr:hypothetical protein [Acidobacteriota bacterium]
MTFAVYSPDYDLDIFWTAGEKKPNMLLPPSGKEKGKYLMAKKQPVLKRNGRHMEPGILVDQQIREARELGWLKIDPFHDEDLEPATYDLRVGNIAVVSTIPKPIDLREKPLLTIEPYASALLQTDEIIELSSKIVGRLGPRSN